MEQLRGLEEKKVGVGTVLLLCLTGLGAGFANGLLGAGGGIIAVFGLMKAMGPSLTRRDALANALCVMLPLSSLSCFRYLLKGHLATEGFSFFLLPALAGGAVGAILLAKAKSSLLKKLFGALVIWSGVMLIIR